MIVSACAPTTVSPSSDVEPRAVETKEEALSIAFQCMAYIGETIDLRRDLILVDEWERNGQEVWDVSFLYRTEEPLCECRERVILEDGTVISPNPGFVPDNPGYYFLISKTDGRILDEGFADTTPPSLYRTFCSRMAASN